MKNSPRQRLINMMYLVLLALLALNIQVDFIDAFFDLSTSIERTVDKLDIEKKQRMFSIQEAYLADSLNYADFYNKSVKATAISDKVSKYIDSLQTLLISRTGGFNEYGYPRNSIDSKISDFIFIQTNGAKRLKVLLFESKKEMLQLLDKEHQDLLKDAYPTSDYIINSLGTRLSWEEYHFNNLALGGSLAILSGFKKDVKMMESVILNYYQYEIFGKLTPFISPDVLGDSASIEIGLSNLHSYNIGDNIVIRLQIPDKKNIEKTEIKLLDQQQRVVKDVQYDKEKDEVRYTIKKDGNYKVSANLYYKDAKENKTIYTQFNVKKKDDISNLTVDEIIKPDRQSILYLGVKNRITIHHPIFESKDLQVLSNNGGVQKTKDGYNLLPEKTGFANIQLHHQGEKIAEKKFLVLHLPDPVVILENTSSGESSLNLFKIQNSLRCKLTEEGLQDAYLIKSFSMQRIDSQGNRIFEGENQSSFFSESILNQVRDAKIGDTYIFYKIMVKSNDGRSRYVSPLLLEIK